MKAKDTHLPIATGSVHIILRQVLRGQTLEEDQSKPTADKKNCSFFVNDIKKKLKLFEEKKYWPFSNKRTENAA